MSRRSRARRKHARLTIADTRATPRALHEAAPRARDYPGIHELLATSRGDAWRTFLESSLRTVLRPAAIASAVGLAVGCGGSAPASESTSTTTVQTPTTTTTTTTTATTTPPVDVVGVQTVVPVTDIPCGGAPPPMQVGPQGQVAQQGPPAPAPPGHHHHPRQPVAVP